MVKLPYYREPHLLPNALPSKEEIRASNVLLGSRGGQRIVAIAPHYVIKYGRSTSQLDGETLLFLEKNAAQIRVPKLYAMFREDGELFVVMELIPGDTLQELWPILDAPKKNLIAQRLCKILKSLREIPNGGENSFYGSVVGGGVPHHLFASYKYERTVTGPFSTENDFNEALVKQFQIIRDTNNQYSSKASFYRLHLSRVLCGHTPTFTHGDVQRKNIMVNEIEVAGKQDYEVCLIDWEFAGWYPDYWEYFAAFTAFRWDDDWNIVLEDFIAPWPAENAMMKMIYTDLFF